MVLTLRNSDDVMSEDRRLLYLGMTDDTKRYSDWETAYVEDVVFRDGCMYVLTYENRDELYSVLTAIWRHMRKAPENCSIERNIKMPC